MDLGKVVPDMGRQRAAVAIGMLFLTLMSVAGPASAQTETNPADAGAAVVVDPVNVNRQLTDGDSTSAFTFRLPEGASCPGDSANDDWRVQSFLVPAGTDIGSLRYRASRPDGEKYRSLRFLDGDIFAMELTNPNPGPGRPGEIVALPPMTLAWFPTGSDRVRTRWESPVPSRRGRSSATGTSRSNSNRPRRSSPAGCAGESSSRRELRRSTTPPAPEGVRCCTSLCFPAGVAFVVLIRQRPSVPSTKESV